MLFHSLLLCCVYCILCILVLDYISGPPLRPNELGELLIYGPQVMPGYRNAPEENAKAFVDGWLRTGDLSYYDETGSVFIKDRLKEVIKVLLYSFKVFRNFELIWKNVSCR